MDVLSSFYDMPCALKRYESSNCCVKYQVAVLLTNKYEIIAVPILSSQVVSLTLPSVIPEVANFCTTMDTLMDQDVLYQALMTV